MLLAALALIAITLSITVTPETLAYRVTGEELDLHSDNGQARGLWASGTHFYVSDPEDDHVYAYRRTDGERDTTKEISLHQDNQDGRGIWGDGTHLWVADAEDKLLYAYGLQGGSRVATQDVTLQDANADARGLTGSKGTDDVRFLYVLDQTDNHVYAYKLENNAAAHNAYESFGIGDETNAPWGVWENADAHHGYYETAWVANAGRIYAHNHEEQEGQEPQDNSNYGDRLQLKDIRLDTGNSAHRGTWSDGEFIWVVDEDDQKLYTYHLDNMRRTVSGTPNFEEGDGGLTGISKIPSGRWKGRIGEYIWANDTYTWNTNRDTKKLHVRDHLNQDLVPSKHITLDGSNAEPRGIWSNGETIWVADDDDHILYAYHLEDKTRQEDQEFALHQDNQDPRGIWSDGTNIWVTDRDDRHVYAYNLDTGARVPELELTLHPDHQEPTGMHGIGNTVWIADLEKNLVYAYLIPNRSPRFDRPHQETLSVTMTSQDEDSLGTLTATDPDAHDITFSVTDPEDAPVRIDETSGEIFLSLDEGETLQPGSDTVITLRAADGRRYDHHPALPGRTDAIEITLSVENTPATGTPSIGGIAHVGQVLTALTAGITDPDGLPDVLTYQWTRVDADGTSNPADIGTNSNEYTVSQDDREKRVKVSVTFTDDGETAEGPLTSDPYPTTGKIPRLTVSFGEDTHTVPEGGSQTVTVTLSADPEATLTIPITTTNLGTATADDYTELPEEVTFESGDTEKEITFQATQDTVDDDGESFKLTFGELPDGVGTGTVSETTVSITDDDFPSITVTFEHPTYTVAESDDPDTAQIQENQATIKVTLSADPERNITILIGKENQGGATSKDYSGVPEDVTFNSGDTEKTITFAATADDVDDDGESVKLTFGTLPAGVSEGTTKEATVSIADDDVPAVTVSFEQATYTAAEGGTVDVKVKLSADPERSVSVPIDETDQGGATSQDYAGVPQKVTFTTGDMEETITFAATQDSYDDDGESVVLGFGILPTGVSTGSTGSATVTITDDDDPTVTANFGQGTYPVAEGGTVQVTVTLNADPEREVTIRLVHGLFGGISDADYSGVPVSLVFRSGETEKYFTFTAAGDDIDDDGESVALTFRTPMPAGVNAGATTTVTITDDDERGVAISKTALEIDEGDSGTYTVRLNTEPTDDVTVAIAGQSGTDITLSGATLTGDALTFTASNWNTAQTVTVSAARDSDATSDAAVTLTHTANGGDYVDVKETLTVTIVEKDTSVLSVGDARAAEDGGNVVFTVRISAANGEDRDG